MNDTITSKDITKLLKSLDPKELENVIKLAESLKDNKERRYERINPNDITSVYTVVHDSIKEALDKLASILNINDSNRLVNEYIHKCKYKCITPRIQGVCEYNDIWRRNKELANRLSNTSAVTTPRQIVEEMLIDDKFKVEHIGIKRDGNSTTRDYYRLILGKEDYLVNYLALVLSIRHNGGNECDCSGEETNVPNHYLFSVITKGPNHVKKNGEKLGKIEIRCGLSCVPAFIRNRRKNKIITIS